VLECYCSEFDTFERSSKDQLGWVVHTFCAEPRLADTVALIYQKCVHQISSVHSNHGDFEIYQYGRGRTARSNPTPAQEVVYARLS